MFPSDLMPSSALDDIIQKLQERAARSFPAPVTSHRDQRPGATRPRQQQPKQPPWGVHTPSATTHDAHQHHLTQLPPSSSTMDDIAVLGKKGYSLRNTLGEGSYSKVKCAYCDRLKREVAVKIIDKMKTPGDFWERFLPREIEALRCLQHPSIIKTYEIFETSAGKVYIVMELGEKGDLLDYIKITGAMREDFARMKFQQLASAIKHCHDSNFAHRDLKCENILLDGGLNIKLTDFGFSKILSQDENGKTILSNTFCGSAAYAAPEVLQGIPCDPRISDIWSLGVILYVMVYALMPFDDSNIRKMIFFQKQHRIPFPSTQDLTAGCKDLINHLLQPNVSQRLCIDEVLNHAWLQTPNSTVESPLSAPEEGECSHNPCEGKAKQKHQAKCH